ncbi:outer membrane lipoprotein-sorting protein [Sutcliffiella deserti]|uniref:outer membrane lipoprotein-sorting protein n=1 Tax=Sutcliffiella deserti TaxID=2875501 RepID=UPI001CC0B674|nr:outer membrane lipoprotein-sorting protein [Sutcliffiella deserti]
MRKAWLLLMVGIVSILVLAGCGTKSQEDVTAALGKKVEEMKSYESNAKMTLQTGAEPQVYEVQIGHKKPTYYRVNLKNAQKDQSQIIIRNDEGVFVLTPALNKSFRFHSEWPQNSSQAYLYESLVNDIKNDPDATFKATEEHYVYETKTNYQNNKLLPTQEITLNKSDLTPVSVKVMDPDKKPLVLVEFSDFKFDASFDEDAFDVKKNMAGAQMGLPTSGQVSEEDEMVFNVLVPNDIPAGSEIKEQKEVTTENGKRVVTTFVGERSFTLVQEKARYSDVATSSFVSGEPVDLGFTVGALTENTLTWNYEGMDFTIASEDLSQDEMMMVARSVQGAAVK